MIYIPAVAENEAIFIQIQVLFDYNCNEKNLYITGMIDAEIEEAVYISLSFLRNKNIAIPNYIHIHFPDYNYRKVGISSSLGILLLLFLKFTNRNIAKKIFLTGEIDLYGNVHPVGSIEVKYKLLRKTSDIDISIFSSKQEEGYLRKDSRVLFVENFIDIVNYLESKGIIYEI